MSGSSTTLGLLQLRPVEPAGAVAPPQELLQALLATTDCESAEPSPQIELPTVLDALAEAVLVIATDGRVWAANAAARALFGGLTLVGAPFEEVLSAVSLPLGEKCPPDQIPLDRAFRGETLDHLELKVHPPSGKETPVLASLSPLRGHHGGAVGAILSLRSIGHLREAERLWEEFVSAVVHESRGALSAILGCVGLVENLAAEPIRPRKTPGYVDPETQFLGMIKADCWQMNQMLTELLDVARIGARDLSLEKQPLDIAALTDDLIENLAPNTGTLVTGHPVRVVHPRLVPIIDADPARVEQILTSLVTTTARYCPPGTEIVIELAPAPGELAISVSSKAGGIPKAELNRLFNYYLRRPELSREHKASGPSLFVARGLVEAHGGRISAEGKQGKGTTFRVSLPLR